MRVVPLGERGLDRAGLAFFGGDTHVCFERAIIGTVSVRRSGGGFGESRTPATSTCGSLISASPWSGNREAKCASGPMPNMAMSNAGSSPSCSMSSRW